MSTLVERALDAIAAAPGDRASPFRQPALATTATDGTPAVRTVVLREFDRAALCATIHADRRSAKIRAIAARPIAELLFWSAPAQLQVRLRGPAHVHAADAVARAAWDALSSGARAAYALRDEPGTPATDPEARVTEAEAFEQFAVLRITAVSIDVLELGSEGAQTRFLASPGGAARRVGA